MLIFEYASIEFIQAKAVNEVGYPRRIEKQ